MHTGSLKLEGRRSQLLSTELTQRFYDRTAPFYSLSTLLFHTRAHERLIEMAGPLNGRQVLEVAVGSGELFRQLMQRNPGGLTAGVDLSPAMVGLVKKRVHGASNGNGRWAGRFLLQAVDARNMPFPDGMFDLLFNCYLFELLTPSDIDRTVQEFRRVLRPGGRLLLVNIGNTGRFFNWIYGWLGYAVPSYWGRQVTPQVPAILERGGFRIARSEVVTQTLYPSLVTLAER